MQRLITRKCFARLSAVFLFRLYGFEAPRSRNQQQQKGIPINRINKENKDVDFVSAGAYAKVEDLLPLFSRLCVSDSPVNSRSHKSTQHGKIHMCAEVC